MRLAISNIAWDVAEDEAVAALLQNYGVDAIDIAPGKYFPQPDLATIADIRALRDWWAANSIEITGMQALLFGTSGLNVFGSPWVQERLLRHLDAVFRIGSELGARCMVFGSPKNRDRSGLTDAEAMACAVSLFRQVGKIADSYGVIVCLEPNPLCYGANFMTSSNETARVVAQIDHPAVRMQFDTGAIAINGEDPVAILQECAALVGHIHASEPHLLPLGDGGTDHVGIAKELIQYLPNHLVTIEMVATQNEPHLFSIERALSFAIDSYHATSERRYT